MNPFDKFLTREDQEHIKVVAFMRQRLPNVLYTHVPAEGRKTPFERYKHSIMGNLKGMPDFLIFYPKLKQVGEDQELLFMGLFIELKAPEHLRIVQKGAKAGKTVKTAGKLSEDQRQLLERFSKLRYKAICCFGAEQAIKEIKEYFNIQ